MRATLILPRRWLLKVQPVKLPSRARASDQLRPGLLNSALQLAANSGLLTQLELEQTKVQAEGPSVAARDQLKEAQTRQIDMAWYTHPQTATSPNNQLRLRPRADKH